jgi:hypothetical protein
MRSPLDLLELPYSFSQLPLLTAEQFRREASGRGVELTEDELEGLHRARALVPLFRVARDGRAIRQAATHDWVLGRQLAHWQTTSRADLVEARNSGLLHDPAVERFISRTQRTRSLDQWTYETSVYVYSQHQMTSLPLIGNAASCFDHKPRREGQPLRLKAPTGWKNSWVKSANQLREVAVASAALEPAFYPYIVGHLTTPGLSDVDEFDKWRRELSPTHMLKWLGIIADWLKNSGASLLRDADRIDPLREWCEVVGHADQEKWKLLRGPARNAMDLRIAAELFLGYHDELVKEGKASRIEQPRRTRGPFDRRLKRTRPLDEVLTEFGLSPHPRLVLIVEGQTELLLVPRVIEMLDLSTDEDFISIQNAEGVTTNLNSLFSYIAPRVKPDEDRRYLALTRPPTRALVVYDPEGPVADTSGREKRRAAWVERILFTLPSEYRSDTVREQLDRLVEVVTWNTLGESFEYAHFTDRQLAAGILRVSGRERERTLSEMTESVRQHRARRGNLKKLMKGSKVGLAEALWPVLESKIRRAVSRGTKTRIPVVAVVDRAVTLAHEYPRKNLVIGLRPRIATNRTE